MAVFPELLGCRSTRLPMLTESRFSLCPGLVESNLRGTSEEQRKVGGMALSPETSGQTILSVIEGKRDVDDGKFVHKDGVYGW
jgi:hypothetical protein